MLLQGGKVVYQEEMAGKCWRDWSWMGARGTRLLGHEQGRYRLPCTVYIRFCCSRKERRDVLRSCAFLDMEVALITVACGPANGRYVPHCMPNHAAVRPSKPASGPANTRGRFNRHNCMHMLVTNFSSIFMILQILFLCFFLSSRHPNPRYKTGQLDERNYRHWRTLDVHPSSSLRDCHQTTIALGLTGTRSPARAPRTHMAFAFPIRTTCTLEDNTHIHALLLGPPLLLPLREPKHQRPNERQQNADKGVIDFNAAKSQNTSLRRRQLTLERRWREKATHVNSIWTSFAMTGIAHSYICLRSGSNMPLSAVTWMLSPSFDIQNTKLGLINPGHDVLGILIIIRFPGIIARTPTAWRFSLSPLILGTTSTPSDVLLLPEVLLSLFESQYQRPDEGQGHANDCAADFHRVQCNG